MIETIKLKLFDAYAFLKLARRYRRQDPYAYSTKDYEKRRRQALYQILQKIPLPQGSSLLDVGCSEGQCTLALAPLFERVVAIDLSHMAIRRARRRAKAAGVTHVDFRAAQLRSAQWPEGFDVVFVGDVLYSVGKRHSEQGFQELMKRLTSWVKDPGYLLLAHAYYSETEFQERLSYRRAAEAEGLHLAREDFFENRCVISLLGKSRHGT